MRGRGEGREMVGSLQALKHFALPAQQMPHSVWHSDLWACSIYTLSVSLQGQHHTHNVHIQYEAFADPLTDSDEAGKRGSQHGVEMKNDLRACAETKVEQDI